MLENFATCHYYCGGGIICFLFGIGTLSWLSFPIGMLFARYQEKIEKLKYSRLTFSLLSIIAIVFYIYYIQNQGLLNRIILLAAFIIMCLTFNAIGILSKQFFSKSKTLTLIGKHSLYPYLTHALVIYIVIDFFIPASLSGVTFLTLGTLFLSYIVFTIKSRISL